LAADGFLTIYFVASRTLCSWPRIG